MNLFKLFKNVFVLLIILQVAPFLLEGIQKKYSTYLEQKTTIGLVEYKGFLSDSTTHIQFLNKLFKDPRIKGILIQMDCSGSATGTGQAIHNEIKSLQILYPKPIVVIVENICASGGYYIASAADYIIAPGMSMIGSIGVCMPYAFQLRELMETYKIKTVPLQAGTYKNATNPFVDMTEQDKKLLQEMLDDAYDQFVSDVAENRHLARTQASEWAEGKIFSGKQAKSLGLIDMLGSMHDAITVMKKRALIDGEIEFISSAHTTGFLSWFCSPYGGEMSIATGLMDHFCKMMRSYLC